MAIPENVTEIGSYAFEGCTKLTSVTLNNKLETIGAYAFAGTSISSIQIPASVTTIGVMLGNIVGTGRSFANCLKLESVTFMGTPTDMNGYTFSGCTALEEITFNSAFASIEKGMFEGCTSLTSFTIPSTVAVVESRAFYGTGISTINIPASVNVVEGGAFGGCSSLKAFTVDSANTNYKAVEGVLCEADGTIVCYPAAITGEKTFEDGTDFLEYALMGSQLSKVVLPSDLVEIPVGLFYESAAYVEIPAGVTKIGEYAFAGNTGIIDLVVPAGVTELGSYAFQGSSVRNVTFKGAPTLSANLFGDCTSLKKVVFEADMGGINTGIFSGSSLEEIVFKGDVGTINTEAFKNLTSLKKFTAEKFVSAFLSNVFVGCTSLEEINLYGQLDALPSGPAFKECSGVKSIYIPSTTRYNMGNNFGDWTSDQIIYTGFTEEEAKTMFGINPFGKATVVYEAGTAPDKAFAAKAENVMSSLLDKAFYAWTNTEAKAGKLSITATNATVKVYRLNADGETEEIVKNADGTYTVEATDTTIYVELIAAQDATGLARFSLAFEAAVVENSTASGDEA